MTYRTTCPHCVSVFRLGTDQLDAAEGWVQCSVCGAAFDARPSLLMEDGSPLPVVEPEPIEPEVEPELVESTPAEADSTTESAAFDSAAETTVETDAASDATESAAETEDIVIADTPQGIIQREADNDLPSIILIDPEVPVSDEDIGPMPHIYKQAYSYDPDAPVYPGKSGAFPLAPPQASIKHAPSTPGPARVPPSTRRIKPWIWAVASTLLLLILLAQATYFLRDTIVSRMPQMRPVFVEVCSMLGCTLSLPKNLALLQIVGSDLQTETRGRLKLVLTLGNRASHVQAWPVLVLTLTDQRNQPLARRSFAPSEYLGDPGRIASGMPARSEQPLSLPLSVDNLAPMGFDLQLTY
jgi:predicted Zn finger-like uncharacterized protein